MSDLYTLAASLAQPVAWGRLHSSSALATLLAAALRAERLGSPYLAENVFHGLQHHFGAHLHRLESRRAVTRSRIRHRLRDLADRPTNVRLAEAHGENGFAGFPFAEEEIAPIVAAAARRRAV